VGRLFSVFLLATILLGGFLIIRHDKLTLESPVGKVIGTSKAEIKNNWFPRISTHKLNNTGPAVSAKSAIAVDFATGEVILERNSQERLPVASTQKIMTALIVFENAELDKMFVVSKKAAGVGENSMGLTAGEKLVVRDLLYGLMLVSGNDAAVALAEGVAGSEEAFVQMMNAKASALGLKNTKFTNASGLDEDGKEQYSAAYDLAVIARYTWENYPEFRKISSTVGEYIDANAYHKAFDLYNDTNLLTTYPGVRGIKPGFTWEAGLCLVTYAENENKKILAVILGSDDRRGEMKEILDYSFSFYGVKILHPALDL